MENLNSLGVEPRSSLPLQLSIWLDGHLTNFFGALVLLLLLGKPFFYTYPSGAAQGEFILMTLHCVVQPVRNWFGTAGNKQERPSFIAVFLFCTVWTALVGGYFWKRQTYVLRLEQYLGAACVALAAKETFWASLAGIAFCDNVPDLVFVVLGCLAAIGALLLAYLVYE